MREQLKKSICFICIGSVKRNTYYNHRVYKYFAEVFEDIIYLDVSRVFTSRLHHDDSQIEENRNLLPAKFRVVSPCSLSEFRNFLKSNSLVAVGFISQTWKDWYIFYYLKKYSIPLVYIFYTSILTSFKYNNAVENNIIVFLLRKFIKSMHFRLYRYFVFIGFFANVDTFFVSKKNTVSDKKNTSSFLYRCLKGRIGQAAYNRIITINSRFYDSFLESNFMVSDDCIVFLDCMLVDHMDQANFGYQPIDRDLYYINLNRVLDIASRFLNKEAFVCLHPQYDQRNLRRDFGSRRAVKYQTEEFIAKSGLVFFHDTTAINTAIMHRKKIIQLLGSKFNEFVKANCEVYQRLMNFPSIDIFADDQNQIQEVVKIDNDMRKYDEFITNNIITSNEKEMASYHQIAEQFNRIYGLKFRKDQDTLVKH